MIEAIIKANKNLTKSSDNNDWEMMGKDIKKVQDLINSLEQVKEKEDKKKEELEKTTNTSDINNTKNTTTNTQNNTENDTINE